MLTKLDTPLDWSSVSNIRRRMFQKQRSRYLSIKIFMKHLDIHFLNKIRVISRMILHVLNNYILNN